MSTTPPSATGLAVLVFDSASKPTANLAWTQLFGPLPDPWLELFAPQDRFAVQCLLQTTGLCAEAQLATGQNSTRLALQSTLENQLTAIWAIPIPPGPADQIGETLERERALGEMRMRFLSLVSHEFRTPLTVILSSAELLEHYGAAWPEGKRQAHFLRMHGAVATMTNLLDNVAFLGRAESGRLENDPGMLAVSALVESVVEELTPLRGIGQEVRFKVDPPNASVNLDSRIVRAVLTNLLSNALRFSPALAVVTVSARVTPESLELTIDDEGKGIPPADADRIWEPFERGSNSVGIPGSGLGLAILRRCMELVGGDARHLPNPQGEGTRAVATFPLSASAAGLARGFQR